MDEELCVNSRLRLLSVAIRTVLTFIIAPCVVINLYQSLGASENVEQVAFTVVGIYMLQEMFEQWVSIPAEDIFSLIKGRLFLGILGVIIILEGIFVFDGKGCQDAYIYAGIFFMLLCIAFEILTTIGFVLRLRGQKEQAEQIADNQ